MEEVYQKVGDDDGANAGYVWSNQDEPNRWRFVADPVPVDPSLPTGHHVIVSRTSV